MIRNIKFHPRRREKKKSVAPIPLISRSFVTFYSYFYTTNMNNDT